VNEGAPERRSEAQRELARLEQAVTDLTAQLADARAELQKARALSPTDPRTGFLSERALHERLAYEIARAARFRRELAVVVAVCERSGDDASRELSDVCRSTARATDLLGVSAPGEVILVLPETPIEGAMVLAERLRTRAAPALLRFGCAAWPHDARGAPELIAAARRALREEAATAAGGRTPSGRGA
jgi:GGDEF domain-containing protein